MSQTIYVLDYYINKYIKLSGADESTIAQLQHRQPIVLEYEEKGRKKKSIGLYLGFDVRADMEGVFRRTLTEQEHSRFDEQQQRVIKDYYPLFKKKFRESFDGSIPITARYQIFTHQVYFYFHSEQRYTFGDFVPNFQKEIGSAVFFFQVGARDIIRLSHEADWMLDADGRQLWARSLRPFPDVTFDDVLLQSLESRDIEKLKDHSGKLKPSLSFERDAYAHELKQYPHKGQRVTITDTGETAIVIGINIMSQQITLKTPDGRQRASLDAISWKPQRPSTRPRKKKPYSIDKRAKNIHKQKNKQNT